MAEILKIFLFSVDLFSKIMYNNKCMIVSEKYGDGGALKKAFGDNLI